MMHITFLGLGFEQLGVSLLSAIAKQQGHRVCLAYSAALFDDRYNFNMPALASLFNEDKEVLKTIERQQPDVLACSPITSTYQWMINIAKRAKEGKPNLKVVFGGPHVSAVPDVVMQDGVVDCLCVGEGDESFPLILSAIERNEEPVSVSNFWYRNTKGEIVKGGRGPFIQDLDRLPIFDKTLWEDYIRVGDPYYTMATRGCPYRCSFCFNSYFSHLHTGDSAYIRYRSVEHVINELRWAKQRYKLKMVFFQDDVFTFNKEWIRTFLERYKKEIEIPFECLSHPRFIDEEIVRWLKEAGCLFVHIGIETLDERYKKEVLKRAETNQSIEKVMALMAKYKINVKTDHMLDLPSEDLSAQAAAWKFYQRYTPYRIQTFWTNLLPGTEMMKKAIADGTLDLEMSRRIDRGEIVSFFRKRHFSGDKKRYKVYKAYECAFKLISCLPPWLKKKNIPAGLSKLPFWVISVLCFLADGAIGLIKNNIDHTSYIRHYFFHIRRLAAQRCHLPVRPATRI